jgi:hypothetical protein
MITSPPSSSAAVLLAPPGPRAAKRLRPRGRILLPLSAVLLVFAACTDEPFPTDPSRIDPGAPPAVALSARAAVTVFPSIVRRTSRAARAQEEQGCQRSCGSSGRRHVGTRVRK